MKNLQNGGIGLEWEKSLGGLVIGVDEVGRGPLVGGVFAGAVCVPTALAERLLRGEWSGINDSKKLSERKREELAVVIKATEGCVWAVASASAAEIDELNILQATHLAMRRAVEEVRAKLGALGRAATVLVDGLPVKSLSGSHNLVKGDAKSLLIAAASILAKTTRDADCMRLDAEYPGYEIARHKGYPTAAHLEAIRRLGLTKEHRRSFGPCRIGLVSALLALLAVGGAAEARDFSRYSDIEFAERYAFSTNRQELIATLKKDSEPWLFYSLLSLQTDGRYAEAREFVDRHHRELKDSNAWSDLRLRQAFLDWEHSRGKERQPGRTTDEALAHELEVNGIASQKYVQEVAVKPNTYPSALDQEKISFDALCKEQISNSPDGFEDRFSFLAMKGPSRQTDYLKAEKAYTPETPGYYEAIVERLSKANLAMVDFGSEMFKSLTIGQLEALQREICEVRRKKVLLENPSYIQLVLGKLQASSEEDVVHDLEAKRAVLNRELKFLRTLPGSKRTMLVDKIREILELERLRGRFAEKELFSEYVEATKAGRPDRYRLVVGELEKAYLMAFRRQGSDLKEYERWLDPNLLAKIRAESDLRAGVDPSAAEVSALSEGEYQKLQSAVELIWSADNPSHFAAAEEVALAIEVKNVGKMRVAIYEIDAYAALVKLGGEVTSGLDLDGCVPSADRTIDYSLVPAVVSHREELKFPELRNPGLYVVECSGAGYSSRALVRKGALRIGSRVGAGGIVFTALDESGEVVKDVKLRLGVTTFGADESGEIAVPFAAANAAGQKIAVIGNRAMATRYGFEHQAESYELNLRGTLPAEGVIAGRTAKAVLRPQLTVAGAPISLGFIEKPIVKLTLTDRHGVKSVRVIEGIEIADDAETVVSFAVPDNLVRADFELSGTVRKVSEGKEEPLCACWGESFNAVASSERIEQALLRRGADGYTLELKGRNGEALAARAVKLAFKHLVFKRSHEETLQTDARGIIRLGKLEDIAFLVISAPVAEIWKLADETTAALPQHLTAAEGEAIELPLRGLKDGGWPMANELRARVSLVERNAAGMITADHLGAIAYTNGILRIAHLAAGDYTLKLRAEQKEIDLKITHTEAKEIRGGLIVGANRGLADTGSPSHLRIAGASVDGAGVVTVKLEQAGEGARVHLATRRMLPKREYSNGLYEMMAREARQSAAVWQWARPQTDYISGRDLGDELRYILDRRNIPHRPGNRLERPSLLLNPWSISETATAEERLREGGDWGEGSPQAETAIASKSMNGNGVMVRRGVVRDSSVYVDFLAEPAGVWCNMRPNAAGVVTFKLPQGAAFQELEVIAADAEGVDRVWLKRDTQPLQCRDLRHFAETGKGETAPRTRSYETIGELYRMLTTGEAITSEFDFIAKWGTLNEDERRELYGKYASHELDLFLYFKDRAFFDAVVAPNLRNKRFKRFLDKWMLGEDLSEYAEMGVRQELNALEQCLLAKRMPRLAKSVADALGGEMAAHPVDPKVAEKMLSKALGVAAAVRSDVLAAPMLGLCEEVEIECEEVDDGGAINSSAMTCAPRRERSVRSKVAAADRARRNSRQLYRPPERTREWIETHHYQVAHSSRSRALVANNPFWSAYAKAIAEGTDDKFRAAEVMYVDGSLTAILGALAVTDLPLVRGDGARSVTFTEKRIEAREREAGDLGIVQRFFDPYHPAEDGEHGGLKYDYAIEEFVAGRVYALSTVVSNPTDRDLPTRLRVRIPDGAIALGRTSADSTQAFNLSDCSMTRVETRFYFPTAGVGVGRLQPAVASVDGKVRGVGEFKQITVVAAPTREDRTSWHWISQRGSSDEVLSFLATENLASKAVNLDLIGWRMSDAVFARKALAVLTARGVYWRGLWSTLLAGRTGITENEQRVRELLMTRECKGLIAEKIGPSFHCSIIEVEPEADDLYEHKEYWPLVNARAHRTGGKLTIANESLRRQYRAFLDLLATHSELSARDRLDGAVYLIAQDRIDEAESLVASVTAKEVETKMQLDYLRAYLAFSRMCPEESRKLAQRYADYPVAKWRERFRKVIVQADEILGKGGAPADRIQKDIASAPSVEVQQRGCEKIVLNTRNVKKVRIRAFPTDVEVTFSKDPFGNGVVKSSSSFLKPIWTKEVAPNGKGVAEVELPKQLLGENLLVEAADEEERVTASMVMLSGALDVQIVKEYGELRVRDNRGRPLPAAYVKVYARDESGAQIKFYKDGYTDLRGVFDYAGVSTDSEFRPSEFAILVLHDQAGVRTVRAPWLQGEARGW